MNYLFLRMPVLLKNDAPFSEGSMNDMIKMWDPKDNLLASIFGIILYVSLR